MTSPQTTPMDIHQVRALIADDLRAVDALILTQLQSPVVLVNQVGQYLVQGGGKRLRPLVCLLAARACGYTGTKHHYGATVIEFIHTATLLHDDVVDESALRRGRATANAEFGNAASVLVGDFIYSRAFQLMIPLDSLSVLALMADATNAIAEGEVAQLMNIHDAETTEARYFAVIRDKTATLFAAAAALGAMLAAQPAEIIAAARDYGDQLGMAFQLIDDLLDYTGDAAQLGKAAGDDLAEGKPTLPLIYALRCGDAAAQQRIRRAIAEGDRDALGELLPIIAASGALEYTRRQAQESAERAKTALLALPPSAYRDALAWLADYAVDRTY